MTVDELVSESHDYSFLRFFADFLTLVRLATAIFILCLGLFVGPEALAAAVIAVFVGWATDAVDGPIARNAGGRQSWVGRMDEPIDLALVFSFFLFLVITGLYPVLAAIGVVTLCALILLVRPTESVKQMVSAPFSALPIVLSWSVSWLLGVVMAVFLLAVLFFKWDKVAGYARDAREEAASL